MRSDGQAASADQSNDASQLLLDRRGLMRAGVAGASAGAFAIAVAADPADAAIPLQLLLPTNQLTADVADALEHATHLILNGIEVSAVLPKLQQQLFNASTKPGAISKAVGPPATLRLAVDRITARVDRIDRVGREPIEKRVGGKGLAHEAAALTAGQKAGLKALFGACAWFLGSFGGAYGAAAAAAAEAGYSAYLDTF
jgi:hypothetical protein